MKSKGLLINFVTLLRYNGRSGWAFECFSSQDKYQRVIELTPEAAQKPKKVIQETKTFLLATNARPIWAGTSSDQEPQRRDLLSCTPYTCEFKTVSFRTYTPCRPHIIPINPQMRSYKVTLQHLQNDLIDMTQTIRKRGHWPSVTEILLVSLYLRLLFLPGLL